MTPDWNTPTNWDSGQVPVGMATFNAAATTAITFSADARVDPQVW